MQTIDRKKINSMSITPSASIKEAMITIGKGEMGTAFIISPDSKEFICLITDGDIRRALLKGATLETKLEELGLKLSRFATTDMTVDDIAKFFNDTIRIVPILDNAKTIIDVACYDKRLRLPVSSPSMSGNELHYVSECISSNWISSTGKFVTKFEEMFADFCKTKYAIATSNGTTALHLALLASNIGPGDEVIVPTLSFIATANAVKYTGATPIFVDSNADDWNIDPKEIAKAVTPKTKAIIPVHLYGNPADMDPIINIANKYNLKIIEDAAEAHGAKYKNKVIGGIGNCGVFSFFGNKIITTGEGGMLVTNDKNIAEKARILRDHGMDPNKRYWHPVLGYNYRLTNIQAAIGVAQIEQIDFILKSKTDIADRYSEQLKNVAGITLPPQKPWAYNVYWLYSILIEEEFGLTRDDLIKELASMHIETRPLFIPIHQQPVYNLQHVFKVAEALSRKGLSLPSSSGLQLYEVDRVCQAIKNIQKKLAK